jgi:hypothetical protein
VHARARPQALGIEAERSAQEGEHHDREAAAERDEPDCSGHLLVVGVHDVAKRGDRRGTADRKAGRGEQR